MALIASRRRRRVTHSRASDDELVARARAGDEQAFLALVARHQEGMLRVARSMVSSAAIAEEVVQETWLGVLRGLDGFAGRASFRTWLLRILANRATSTGMRERRSVAVGDAVPAVDASRFEASGAWMSPPQHWVEDSENRVFAESAAMRIQAALDALPERQREVVMLRDIDELSGAEVCEALEISEANQRVLLHRGRSQLRQVLENELGGA